MRARIVALAAALWRARAADEAALAASVSTDASGLFTLGYYWYGILRQPSFHEEFEKCAAMEDAARDPSFLMFKQSAAG